MTDMMECFNDPQLGSHDQAEVGEFANVTGLVLGRNDSFHNVEMGFKDPDNPESPSKAPSMAPSRNVSVSQDPQEDNSAKYLNEIKAALVEDEPSPVSPKADTVATGEPRAAKPATPKKLSSYDFSYSADSHDSPPKEKTQEGDPKYRRQVSSPIMDHLIETLSDENDAKPQRENPAHEEELNQFMESIPSKFDKAKPDPFERPKISPRVTEKIEERRKSSAQPVHPVADGDEHSNRQSNSRPPPRRDNHGDVDEQDMAVIMAKKEKKKKKKPNDSYMGEFEVVSAGKKPIHAAPKDYDELDMKNRPRKKKSNDSYLSEIPVVRASKSPRSDIPEISAGRRPSKPKEPNPPDQAELKNRNGNMGVKRGRSQKPAANDNYLADIPVVRVKKNADEKGLGGKEGRSSYEEIEFKRKMKDKTPVANRHNRADISNNSISPERGYKPQPPSNKKPSGGRKVEPVQMLPRLVQSDQTDSRNKKIRNDVGSRDDSNDYGEPAKPRRKKKKPLFMRLQEKALRQEGEREREKMAAYAVLKEKKKMGQPSHQELLEHRQKYAELKHQEELRKQEAREFREHEWRKMQKMLEEKNEAVVSHVPHSVSPLKRRNSSNAGGSDDDSTATPYSHVSQKKKKKRRSKIPSETDDDDSVSSAAVHRHDDVYLPNIVSPAKLSPRGIGKARRAKRREGESDENREPRHNNKHRREDVSDMPHDEDASSHRQNGAGRQVRMSIPDEVRPEPIQTEKQVEEPEGHVRFAEGQGANNIAITRKSLGSDNSGGKTSDLNTENITNLRGPQYLAELLEADQHEEDLAKMYETGFEMQMVERGMMETPSAAKAAAGAHKRIPV